MHDGVSHVTSGCVGARSMGRSGVTVGRIHCNRDRERTVN